MFKKVKRLSDGKVFDKAIIHGETEEAIVSENGLPVLLDVENYEIVPEVRTTTSVLAMIAMLQGGTVKTQCGREYKYCTTEKMFVDVRDSSKKLDKLAGKLQTMVWLAS
jgi:hypothetical protein